MFCFTLLKLLVVCRWILVFILFYGDWHMLCQRLKSCTPNICSHKRGVYCLYCVHFPHYLFGFALFCSLSLSSCSLLVHFSLVSWVSKIFFATIYLYCAHSPCCWVCIVLLFIVIFFFNSLIVVWVSDFFVFINIFFGTSTSFFSMNTRL